ncbi:hypothetical protein [Runella aurantiaca]|uniref:Uncharacterized protein n=1 Tax=Runella aurantiaca TaxID=2282308 RepID=A0A369I5D8_9BACT|nr:hypothetical protein [Runella aurantiaca]RDB04262.1 hypothetical protein DVG78_19950 [Runella aurantiaca]
MLFWYALIGFFISVFENSFIKLVNLFKAQVIPILQKLEIDDTFFISPFYYVNELLFLGLFYSRVLKDKTGEIVRYAAFVLAGLEILNTVFGEGYKDAQKMGSLLLSLNGIVLPLLFFRQYYTQKNNTSFTQKAYSWISWGILTPYIFSLLIYFLSDSLVTNYPILFYQLSIVRMSIDIIGILMMSYGVSLVRAHKRT